MFQEFRGVEDGEDNARVKNRQVAKAAAQVLELESAGELCFALTTLRTETRGQQLKYFLLQIFTGDLSFCIQFYDYMYILIQSLIRPRFFRAHVYPGMTRLCNIIVLHVH